MTEQTLRTLEFHRRSPTAEALLEAQKEVLERIVRGRPLHETLDALCRAAESLAPVPVRAAILLVNTADRTLHTAAAPSLPPGYSEAIDGIAISPTVGTCAAAAARGQAVITPDIATAPGWAGLSHLPLELGLKAAWSLPILSSEGMVLGTFGTYFLESREPLPQERQLIEVLARTAALAIERQRSDEALARMASTDHALAQNRARLEYAVRLSGIGYWSCDLPFDELIWDERVKDHFFLPPDARVTIDDFYARIHPEDREPTRVAIETSIQNRTLYDVVYRTVDPDTGSLKWIRALGGTLYGPDSTPLRFDGVTVDVTVQTLDQIRLAELNQRLREDDRRKDEFLATLAHELRNPLAPIRTGLHVLRATVDPEQVSRVREMMERQLTHLVRMVDDLLDISRVTLGKVTLKRERVDFRAVLHSALETTRPLIEAASHELAVRLPQDPFPLDVDPTRLAQVLANVLNNAVKYTPHGGRIQLTAEKENDILVVRISDTGVGIAAEMLPRVFDLFTQAGQSLEHSQGGLGLGLTLVRRLVEMHEGSIEARSPGIGQGSTFVLRLPLATNDVEVLEGGDRREGGSALPLRILVVDDNRDAAESLAMLLGLDGHQTQIANSGEAALTAVHELVPDVAFIDIGLPDLSGYEVARRLRAADGGRKPLFLVALTGWGADEDRRQAHQAGFDLHLVKPADLEGISTVLAKSVRR